MTPENRDIPAWAQRERQGDLGWIAENLGVFSAIASVAFEDEGRGAIVVDTTSQSMPGAGHPFGYFLQEQIEEQGDEDITRMVGEYDPTQEFVVVLLKREDRTSYNLPAKAFFECEITNRKQDDWRQGVKGAGDADCGVLDGKHIEADGHGWAGNSPEQDQE